MTAAHTDVFTDRTGQLWKQSSRHQLHDCVVLLIRSTYSHTARTTHHWTLWYRPGYMTLLGSESYVTERELLGDGGWYDRRWERLG